MELKLDNEGITPSMKYIFLITSLIVLIGTQAHAKKVKGWIYRNNEKIEVTFKIPFGIASGPVYERIQNRIVYFDQNGKRNVLKPEDAKEFRFDYEGEEIRMVSVNGDLEDGAPMTWGSRIFLKLEIDGMVKLYRHDYTQTNYSSTMAMSTSYNVERYLLQKGNEKLKRPRTLTFRKDMLQYFSECPELCDKIESKEFKKRELESIVEFYNAQCK